MKQSRALKSFYKKHKNGYKLKSGEIIYCLEQLNKLESVDENMSEFRHHILSTKREAVIDNILRAIKR
jgi:hypothetical protein